MRRYLAGGVLLAALAAAPAGALDASTPLVFTDLITDTCLILSVDPGGLTMGPDGTTIVTDPADPATATVITSSTAFELSVVLPTAFTLPASGVDSTFSATMDATGDTILSGVVASVAQTLAFGTTDVEVFLSATKDSGVYPTGTYTATATLQCVAS